MEPVIFDAHCDTLSKLAERGGASFLQRNEGVQADLPRLLEGGVAFQVLALFVPPDRRERATPVTLVMLERLLREVAAAPDRVRLVTKSVDIEETINSNRLGVIASLEGADALAESIDVLELMFRLGVRCIGLTWNGRGPLADGVDEGVTGGGLTRLGRAVVERMNSLGMVVDVSHLSEAGFWQVLECTTRPVIASHSNCRALCDVPRNLSDSQIKALAESGGVVGINFYPPFLNGTRIASLDDVIRHIAHVADLVGPWHVGIGSDFDGIDACVEGLEDASRLPRLRDALLNAGFDPAETSRVLGGNFAELFQRILPRA